MLRAGDTRRFTPDEIEDFRKIGLDFDGAQTQDDIEQVLTRWADTLNDERPDLLEKIATEPVSYTHLDVYKRQGLSTANTTSAARRPEMACALRLASPRRFFRSEAVARVRVVDVTEKCAARWSRRA